MKNIKRMKKKFVNLCNEKRKKKKTEISDIARKMSIEKESLEKFFSNRSNATLNTILKVLSYLDLDLIVK